MRFIPVIRRKKLIGFDEIYWRIMAYEAVGGLLWSNWCEFKEDLGIYFDKYPETQYRYAKKYSEMALDMLRS